VGEVLLRSAGRPTPRPYPRPDRGQPEPAVPRTVPHYLRTHPNSARTVELSERQLAKYHADDVKAYYDIKDPVYDLIWDAA
jgi:hypothetical protein